MKNAIKENMIHSVLYCITLVGSWCEYVLGQWNPSIAATLGEWHFGCYTEVSVVEGFLYRG